MIKNMIGQIFGHAEVSGDHERLTFVGECGIFQFYHNQDCCESVQVEDVTGDLEDLIGTPILGAEESSDGDANNDGECGRWTFYKFRTIKGYVTVRFWGGESYYGDEVDVHFEDGGNLKWAGYPFVTPPYIAFNKIIKNMSEGECLTSPSEYIREYKKYLENQNEEV